MMCEHEKKNAEKKTNQTNIHIHSLKNKKQIPKCKANNKSFEKNTNKS